jgi:PIN domain nuclease of toxin-antitoxin system
MTETVLDASAVLAVLGEEVGADMVVSSFPASAISAVNFAEVGSKLAERGLADHDIERRLGTLPLRVAPFDQDAANETIRLRDLSRSAGLSLGDRACLALAMSLGAPVLTADRTWARLKLNVDIRLIR